MNYFVLIVVVVAVAAFFYPKGYVSSPGHVDAEYMENFMKTVPQCFGWSRLTNPEQVAADYPGKSVCFGILIKK